MFSTLSIVCQQPPLPSVLLLLTTVEGLIIFKVSLLCLQLTPVQQLIKAVDEGSFQLVLKLIQQPGLEINGSNRVSNE